MKRLLFCILSMSVCMGIFAQQLEEFTWEEFEVENESYIIITGYTGTIRSITIPRSINGMWVAGIGEGAFKEKNLTSVIFPPRLGVIDLYAFYGNKLTSVIIPEYVQFIGEAAFSNNLLTNVQISSKLKTTIGDTAFHKNRLTSVTIPPAITSIGIMAFGENQITSVTIGENVELGDMLGTGILGIAANFNQAYNSAGRRAGTYTRTNTTSSTWTRR